MIIKKNLRINLEVIWSSDRIKWASQAMGVWKVKIGTVKHINEKNYIVAVDTVIPVTEDDLLRCGEDKVLKKPQIYTPRKSARYVNKFSISRSTGRKGIMKDENVVDPDKDCGTIRCTYHCDQCPFGIPERIDMDLTAVKC